MDIAKIRQANTAQELQTIGKIEDITDTINIDIKPLKITASSYDELFKNIETLNSKWVSWIDGPFKSEQDKYIFFLTKLEGKQRNQLLGIENKHYEDKNTAKSWYRSICKYVHPDKNGSKEAFSELTKLYENLIEDYDMEND